MANREDDEWEYEYDDTETEDFYISLDLSNVPAAQLPVVSQGRPGHPTLLKSRLRALNAARGQQASISVDTPNGQETATMGEVQVVGLHTPNPLVMYNGQLLSCHWTSTIGTDMYFVKPDANQSQPLRSLPSVDLLSMSSAKLIAKVGRLRPRDDLFDNTGDTQQPTESMPAQGDTQNPVVVDSNLAGEQRSTSGETKAAPPSFLARLNAAKAKKREKARLFVVKTSEGSRLMAEKANTANNAPARSRGDTVMGGT
ncbi:transcription factor tfiiic tau55-related [Pyrenophora seminiperda CCB06]|uniref:Transcription factor tfiiic tau55-related n=1 Tax=Pyrenophora seminiperda CCB06 TaxID=1302712 RepID=A0A3M7M5P2_9PLEO|nr:transcription factor tfiiic tau55-related [Pyrenophora seminiperda CCB06]